MQSEVGWWNSREKAVEKKQKRKQNRSLGWQQQVLREREGKNSFFSSFYFSFSSSTALQHAGSGRGHASLASRLPSSK